ncbi:hypothetical protein [Natrinema salinisoli]|uniref:hypothetical protein n=1 Tax=Natrinema salinisoli TaxID=2878535 RepID=UPI001CF03112|nr:hypothetical protein [Natrinema salinisoli]
MTRNTNDDEWDYERFEELAEPIIDKVEGLTSPDTTYTYECDDCGSTAELDEDHHRAPVGQTSMGVRCATCKKSMRRTE